MDLAERIANYSALDPERAVAEAASDVMSERVRLFYRCVGEVSTVLGIDPRLERPEHECVFIGDGCADETQNEDCPEDCPDDCPEEYGRAHANAEVYGSAYNAEVARRLGLRFPDEDASGNVTARFFGPEADWTAGAIRLDDVVGPFGGRVITVPADGPALVVSLRPGKRGLDTTTHEVGISDDDRRRIVRSMVEHDFLAIDIPFEPAAPDTARPRITVTSASGEERSREEWIVSLPPPIGEYTPPQRFAAVHAEILRLERLAQA